MWLELEAGRRRDRRDYERDVTLAWATEFMARQKKLGLKSLEKLLHPRGRKQTPQEQRHAVMQIAAMYGMKTEFRPRPTPTQ